MNDSKQKEELFNKLYNENYEKVVRICSGYVKGNIVIAKDLAQEVFVKVWENLNKFQGKSKISTWIFRIAVNTCLLYKRKSNKTLDYEFPIDSKEDKQLAETKMKILFDCINKLSPQNKSIILLELESIPQKEIAEIMGMSHSAVRVRLLRIKETLSKLVKE